MPPLFNRWHFQAYFKPRPRTSSSRPVLNAFDSHSPLTLQLLLIPILLLLLAVLQPGTGVRLQHPVLAAEVTVAESAVAYYALRLIFAVLEAAANLLWGAASDWECHVECAFTDDRVIAERAVGREVLAGVDEAEVGLGEVGAESQQRSKSRYRCGLRDGYWEGCERLVMHCRRVRDMSMLTVSCDVLNEYLHRLFGLSRRSAG